MFFIILRLEAEADQRQRETKKEPDDPENVYGIYVCGLLIFKIKQGGV